MKVLSIVLSILLMSCSATKMQNEQPFDLINATSQKWYGGAAGSGYGTEYKFFFEKKSDTEVAFDTVWINDRAFIPEIANVSFPLKNIEKGHQFSLNMNYRFMENKYTGEVFESPVKDEAGSPEYAGDALLIYKVNGERKTMIIQKIEAKTPNFYQ